MDNNALREKMIQLFETCFELSKDFKKKTYEDQIQKTYESCQELYQMIQERLATSDDAIAEISGYIPDYAEAAMSGLTKRKQELKKIDNNMAMVSFFVPLMGKVRSDKTEQLTDGIVAAWNEKFPDSKIGKSTVDTIQGGFKNGLCYITTAVCGSLHKGDDCYELTLLRDYRDSYLLTSDEGMEIVKEYYNIAPTIVNRIGQNEDAEAVYQDIWQKYLQPCVEMIEKQELEACRANYTRMVHELEDKYLYS